MTVTDDQGVVPVYQSGDTNTTAMLDPGEMWIYTATGTAIAPGSYRNIGTATGTDATGTVTTPVSASATDGYFGVQPGIAVDEAHQRRRTIRNVAAGGDGRPGPTTSRNTGNVALSGVTLTDDQASCPSTSQRRHNGNGLLDPGESVDLHGHGHGHRRPIHEHGTATAATDGHGRTPVSGQRQRRLLRRAAGH